MQDDRPFAYTSKNLTKTEKMYTQIEKELLAIVLGCKKFHQYTYGRGILIHSDHKPIASIMKKPLSAVVIKQDPIMHSVVQIILRVGQNRGQNVHLIAWIIGITWMSCQYRTP